MTFSYGVGSINAYRLGEQNYDLPHEFLLLYWSFLFLFLLISTVVDKWFFFTFVCY